MRINFLGLTELEHNGFTSPLVRGANASISNISTPKVIATIKKAHLIKMHLNFTV